MKRFVTLGLMLLFWGCALFAQRFPGQTQLYFCKGADPLCLIFGFDRQTNEPICSTTHSFASQCNGFLWEKNSSAGLEFRGYKVETVYKAVSSGYGMLPTTMPAGVRKVNTNHRFTLAADYSRVVINGHVYRRISQTDYERLQRGKERFQGGYSGGTYSPGNGGGSYGNGTENRHGDVRCKGCNGTGKCSMCKGRGVYEDARGDWYNCPSCNRTGRCGVCHGKGTIHY